MGYGDLAYRKILSDHDAAVVLVVQTSVSFFTYKARCNLFRFTTISPFQVLCSSPNLRISLRHVALK